jgi:hypothetical protein
MQLFRRSALLTISALFLALTLLAQKPPDPQSSFEPRSGAGAGQKFLEKLAGDWDVVKTFYPRSGEPSRSTGSCRQTMIHEGRFLESEFTFDGPSGKTVGLGLIGFEPETGLFTSVWTDSRSTRMSIRRSEAPFNGEEIALFGKSLDPDSAARPRSRTVTHLEEGGHRLVHRQYVPDADGKERLMMELLMTKR